jgi:hypothetical protein
MTPIVSDGSPPDATAATQSRSLRAGSRLTPHSPLSAGADAIRRRADAERGDSDPRRQGVAPPPLASLRNLPSPREAALREPPLSALKSLGPGLRRGDGEHTRHGRLSGESRNLEPRKGLDSGLPRDDGEPTRQSLGPGKGRDAKLPSPGESASCKPLGKGA